MIRLKYSRNLVSLVLSSIVLLLLVSCNNTSETDNVNDTNNAIDPIIEQIVNLDMEALEGEVLTIAISGNKLVLLEFTQRYMIQNPGITIEIICYEWLFRRDGNLSAAQQEIGVQLMAGTGPVLIDSDLVDYLNPASQQLLFDWFPLMQASPDFNEDDWFMNVFHATSINGRLYKFPVGFDYVRISYNSLIPGLSEIMSGREGITFSELFDIYDNFTYDKTHNFMYFFSLVNLRWVLPCFIDNFIDLENGIVDFNDEFIEFITYANNIASFAGLVDWSHPEINFITLNMDAYLSERYFFRSFRSIHYNMLLDVNDVFSFKGYIPIVDTSGEVFINTTGGGGNSWLLNANATSEQLAIAWDFIQFRNDPSNFPGSWDSHFIPTNRDMLMHQLKTRLYGPGGAIRWLNPDVTLAEALGTSDIVFEKITEISERPLRNFNRLPDSVNTVLWDAVSQFTYGLVSAEQTAQNLQNQIELMIMEMGLD